MTKTLEEKMNELPEERQENINRMYIKLVETQENEDGSAVYSFDLSEDVNRMCGELGLKLLLYCGVCQIGPEQAFETIFKVHAAKEDQENKWKACVSCGGPSQNDFCSFCVEEE